jgi:hypothetical protein
VNQLTGFNTPDYYIITGWFPGVKKADMKIRLEGSTFVLNANVTKDEKSLAELGDLADVDEVDEVCFYFELQRFCVPFLLLVQCE